MDTNCNPQGIDYVIPSNDDAIRAIKLLVAKIADAVLEGKALRKEEEPEAAARDTVEEQSDKPRVHRPVKVVDTDEDVNEDALLGEATLAKLSATRKPEDVLLDKDKVEEKAEVKADEPLSTPREEITEVKKDDGN